MINLLIGFMIIPTILGILLLVFWSIEFFKYIMKSLKKHYNKKLEPTENEQKEDPEIEVITETTPEDISIDDEEIKEQDFEQKE